MFVMIHEKTAQNFGTLGLGALVPISCEVEEELNGAFELELEHPYDEWGKWKRIEKGRIVVASTPRGPQPFRIYQIKPDMDTLKVNARHIFYDLLDNMVSLKYTGTAAGALEAFQGAFNFAQPFTFDTDISLSSTMSVGKMNPVQALLLYNDEEYSGFIQTYGGELLRDGYHVSVKNSLGRDNGVAIRYGKNLTGLEITEDEEDVKTHIHLYNERGQSVTLDSPRIGEYPYPKIYIGEESSATQSELQTKAQELLDGGIDLPSVNIKVEFIPLAKTVEYADFAILEEAHLGDIVTVVNQKMDFSKQAKVISYKWDCLLEQYDELELGDFMPTLVTSVTSGARSGSLASSANATASTVATMLQNHMQDYTNPHHVTAEQTGGSSGGGGDCQAILYGSEEPSDNHGEDGDVYVLMREGEDENTLLLLHGETAEDASVYGNTITNNGVELSAAQSKFGGKAMYFNGTSTLQMTSEAFDFKGRDFTIDWWERAETGTKTRFCTQFGVPSTGMSIGNDGTKVNINSDYGTANFDLINNWVVLDVTVGQWVHWALVRNGNILSVYKNGVHVGTKSITGTLNINLSKNAAIGANPGNNNNFIGYIDEFRVSNVARWTSDFTPPSEPYAAVAEPGALYIKINGTWKLALKGAV